MRIQLVFLLVSLLPSLPLAASETFDATVKITSGANCGEVDPGAPDGLVGDACVYEALRVVGGPRARLAKVKLYHAHRTDAYRPVFKKGQLLELRLSYVDPEFKTYTAQDLWVEGVKAAVEGSFPRRYNLLDIVVTGERELKLVEADEDGAKYRVTYKARRLNENSRVPEEFYLSFYVYTSPERPDEYQYDVVLKRDQQYTVLTESQKRVTMLSSKQYLVEVFVK